MCFFKIEPARAAPGLAFKIAVNCVLSSSGSQKELLQDLETFAIRADTLPDVIQVYQFFRKAIQDIGEEIAPTCRYQMDNDYLLFAECFGNPPKTTPATPNDLSPCLALASQPPCCYLPALQQPTPMCHSFVPRGMTLLCQELRLDVLTKWQRLGQNLLCGNS